MYIFFYFPEQFKLIFKVIRSHDLAKQCAAAPALSARFSNFTGGACKLSLFCTCVSSMWWSLCSIQTWDEALRYFWIIYKLLLRFQFNHFTISLSKLLLDLEYFVFLTVWEYIQNYLLITKETLEKKVNSKDIMINE